MNSLLKQKLPNSRKNPFFLYLFLIITLGIGIRIWYFPFDIPIASDGYFSFVYAAKIVFEEGLPIGYTTTNTGWSYFLALIFSISDNTEPFQLMTIQRSMSIIISCITIIPIYYLLIKFVNKNLALLGCLLFILEPRLLLISLDGINFTLFLFLFVTSITLFLKKTNLSIILSFVCVAIMSLVRYEGILLLISFSVMYIVFNKKNKDYLKLIGLISLVMIILVPVSIIRMDATNDLCYNSIFGEICGRDGIFDNLIHRATSVNDKIIGIPDIDDPIYNKNESMFGHFLIMGFYGLLKFLILLSLPFFFIFIGLSIFRIKKKKFSIKSEYLFLIISTITVLLPAIYAYGRGIEDYRYVLVVVPILTVFSVKIMNSVPKFEKVKKEFVILGLIIILITIGYIEYQKIDYQLHRETFEVSKKVNELTDTINSYQYSGYIKSAKLLDEWPKLPNSDPLRSGKLEMVDKKIPTTDFKNIHDFIRESREDNLQYIVEYSEDEFFNDLRENPVDFEYLEKIFDSKELGFKNEFRIYKINIRD